MTQAVCSVWYSPCKMLHTVIAARFARRSAEIKEGNSYSGSFYFAAVQVQLGAELYGWFGQRSHPTSLPSPLYSPSSFHLLYKTSQNKNKIKQKYTTVGTCWWDSLLDSVLSLGLPLLALKSIPRLRAHVTLWSGTGASLQPNKSKNGKSGPMIPTRNTMPTLLR